MKKYTIDTYRNYIEGNDPGFPLEELENDSSFMKVVINITNDPNMVKMCSKELLKDYDFVKFIINKFKINKKHHDFICGVAENFFKNTNNYDDIFDLSVRMLNIIKDENNIFHHIYADMCIKSYENVMNSINKFKRKNTNKRVDVGMGFYIVEDVYGEYDEIKKFFAKIFLGEIFNKEIVNIENDLHRSYASAEKVEEIGISNYILNRVQKYDLPLKSYLVRNMELIEKIIDEIKIYLRRWKYFEEFYEAKIYDAIFDQVHSYMDTCSENSLLSEVEILYFVAKKLGIEEKVIKYDCVNNSISGELMTSINDGYVQSILSKSVTDYANYKNVLDIVKDAITCDNIDSLLCETYSNDNNEEYIHGARHHVIHYDFKNKRIIDNRG